MAPKGCIGTKGHMKLKDCVDRKDYKGPRGYLGPRDKRDKRDGKCFTRSTGNTGSNGYVGQEEGLNGLYGARPEGNMDRRAVCHMGHMATFCMGPKGYMLNRTKRLCAIWDKGLYAI